MKAAVAGGNTAIAVRGAESAVFITQKKVSVCLVVFVLHINRCISVYI
jgi:hypothetical protein